MNKTDFGKVELLEIQHNTPAWQKIRAGKFTASSFSSLGKTEKVTEGMIRHISDKVHEQITGEVLSFANYHTERGHELESYAFMKYCELNDVFGLRNMMYKVGEHICTSPDAIIDETNSLLEIKCPTYGGKIWATIYQIVVNDCDLAKAYLVKEYYWQLQFQLWCSGMDYVDLFLYSPIEGVGSLCYTVRIEPNEDDQEFITRKLSKAIEIKKEMLQLAQKHIVKDENAVTINQILKELE